MGLGLWSVLIESSISWQFLGCFRNLGIGYYLKQRLFACQPPWYVVSGICQAVGGKQILSCKAINYRVYLWTLWLSWI